MLKRVNTLHKLYESQNGVFIQDLRKAFRADLWHFIGEKTLFMLNLMGNHLSKSILLRKEFPTGAKMKGLLLIMFFSFVNFCFAQDLTYTRKTLTALTSPALWGRGYTKNGMANAADFIEKEFAKMKLKPIQQVFSFPVNTFPGRMELSIDGKKLIPGRDFIVSQASKGVNAAGTFVQKDSLNFINEEQKLILTLQSKLTWSVATKVENYTQILVKKDVISQQPQNFTIDIENQFFPEFKASNVYASIKGKKHPDSIVVISAHYDHLGGMGNNTYFPGANDNASGVSFLLSLAKHYAKNPPPYTIAFICFGAEEAGLIGSKYFTENPLVDLSKIRFLLNLDLVGTGETGATVVNATLRPKEFALLNAINANGKFLVKINPRGKAANSDHYFFTEKGVPAFFLYTQGGIAAYHDVDDKAETLPFTVYDNLFKLVVGFTTALMK
ncbi:M20/M25/M40 family metallo-hydrolase [Pedobacter sp. Du54]|uniref:M28 family metallopeptidase n=1 Tax=Pedobacter anseongensis TaxID=3133439 RepID=UPI003094D9F7